MGVVSDAVGGRPEQIVAEEVALVSDDDQVVIMRLGIVADHLRGMAGHKLRLQLDPALRGLSLSVLEDPGRTGPSPA
jgi:hypothetical protein